MEIIVARVFKESSLEVRRFLSWPSIWFVYADRKKIDTGEKFARNASLVDRMRPVGLAWTLVEPPIHRYPPDEPAKPRDQATASSRENGLDIHVFKFIYWQDFCFGEGVVGNGGRGRGLAGLAFLVPFPSILQSTVKPLPLDKPFLVIFPLKEISANYAACPTAVEF